MKLSCRFPLTYLIKLFAEEIYKNLSMAFSNKNYVICITSRAIAHKSSSSI